jgi:hypothetical protein
MQAGAAQVIKAFSLGEEFVDVFLWGLVRVFGKFGEILSSGRGRVGKQKVEGKC